MQETTLTSNVAQCPGQSSSPVVDGWAKALSIQANAQTAKVAEAVHNLKKCKKCGKIRPLNEFALYSPSTDGHRNTCRECFSSSVSAGKRKQGKATAQHICCDSRKPDCTPHTVHDIAATTSSVVKAPDGREPREVIDEIRRNVAILRSIGWTCEVALSYPRVIKI